MGPPHVAALHNERVAKPDEADILTEEVTPDGFALRKITAQDSAISTSHGDEILDMEDLEDSTWTHMTNMHPERQLAGWTPGDLDLLSEPCSEWPHSDGDSDETNEFHGGQGCIPSMNPASSNTAWNRFGQVERSLSYVSEHSSIPGEIHGGVPKSPPASRTNHSWNAFFDDFYESEGIPRRVLASGSSISKLQSQFAEVGDCSGFVSETALCFHMQESLEKQSGPLAPDRTELLKETVRRRYAEIDLGLHDGSVGEAEWIHFMMMRRSSPSAVATKHLNLQLCMSLPDDPILLNRLHSAFGDLVQPENEYERNDNLEQAFREVGVSNPSEDDLSNYDFLTYFEFVSLALGAKLESVQLAMYDTSDGAAKWIPSVLLGGHKFEGIWHTGVRVFGREFWYGGGAFCQDPENVPFGKPVRIIELGKTLRSFAELKDFLHFDLLYTFNRASYDVLNHNCNDFSDEVVRFLLYLGQIPEEIRMQPQWAKNAALTKMIKPILQQRLGSFGDEASTLTRQCDDMTEEWRRRLRKGDIALFRTGFLYQPFVVQIVTDFSNPSAADGLRHTDIAFFMHCSARGDGRVAMADANALAVAEWRLAQRLRIPASQLYPCFNDHIDMMHLQINLHLDSAVGEVLRRLISHPMPPVCPKGHALKEQALNMITQPPPCSVCGAERASLIAGGNGLRTCCQVCSFECCSDCFKRGCHFHGDGVFADIMTLSLVIDLLANPGWLKYKASAYYYKADFNVSGLVEFDEMHKLVNRIRVELGLAMLCMTDLQTEMDLCSHLSAGGDLPTHRDLVNVSLNRPKKLEKQAVELECFALLFEHTLAEALITGTAAVPFDPTSCKTSGIRRVLAKVGDEFIVAL